MSRKLTELNPRFQDSVLVFDCPCKFFDQEGKCFGRIRIPVKPKENGWDLVSGSSVEDLTLSPSILIHPSGDPVGSFCAGWHGYLRNGRMEECS